MDAFGKEHHLWMLAESVSLKFWIAASEGGVFKKQCTMGK